MKFIKKIIRFVVFTVLISLALIIAVGYGKYTRALEQLPVSDAINSIKSSDSFTPIDEVSKTFINAIVAVEDRRFYKHKGVDLIGVARAVKTDVKAKAVNEGGSTITQQLAKNIYFMNDNSLSRKVAEIMTAIKLEKELSKKQILEAYVNVIYYGSGYYTVAQASRGYFNKTPLQLSDYEATLLAGIPNAPSVYSLNNNPALAKKRQKTVLTAMYEEKMLTQEELEKILQENQ